MNIEPALEQQEIQEPANSLPVPRGWWGIACVIFILIMPVVAFWATDLFLPEWQDGKFSSYIILLLSPKASLLFFPLLAFSIVSYILLAINPTYYSGNFIVRLGVYTGVLLALQFSIVSALFFLSDNPASILLIVGWFAPIVVARVYPWAVARWGAARVIAVIAIIIIVQLILSIILKSASAPILLLFAGLTAVSPFWSLLVSLRAAIWLFKYTETGVSLQRGLGLTAWLAAYLIAWRFSILKMYELYAALPPQPPPDCYIATAAAQGHPRFVGAKVVVRSNGTSLQVNRQLQNLKCAELALMAVYPRLHKVLRRVYDVVGRALARRLRNPFVADLAYLCLKPVEWIACAALRMLIPEMDGVSKKMYL